MPIIIYRFAVVGLILLAACILLEVLSLGARAFRRWRRRRSRR